MASSTPPNNNNNNNTMDPRKRWNNNHQSTEDLGNSGGFSYPQQQQQYDHQYSNNNNPEQPLQNNNHPKFRNRFNNHAQQPPPPSSSSDYPQQQQAPPPNFPPPPSHNPHSSHPHSQQQQSQYPTEWDDTTNNNNGRGKNTNNEYYVPLNRGDNNNTAHPGGRNNAYTNNNNAALDNRMAVGGRNNGSSSYSNNNMNYESDLLRTPQQQQQQPPPPSKRLLSSSLLASPNDSNSSLKNRWKQQAMYAEKEKEEEEMASKQNGRWNHTTSNGDDIMGGRGDMSRMMPPPSMSRGSQLQPPSSNNNFINPPPSSYHPTPPPQSTVSNSSSYHPDQQQQPPTSVVSSSYSSSSAYPPPSQSSISSYHPDGQYSSSSNSGGYNNRQYHPDQPPSSSSSSSYHPDAHQSSSSNVGGGGGYQIQSSSQYNNNPQPQPGQVKSEEGYLPPPPQAVPSSAIKSEEELVDTDNEEEEPQQQQPPTEEEPIINDAMYTTSLHWNNPTSSITEKRPIALPTDVIHIQDVEWADSSPAEMHQVKNSSSSNNLTSSSSAVAESSSNICQSAVSNLERAPRPKKIIPDQCFCEPNLTTQEMCCMDSSCALRACQEECGTNCEAGKAGLCGNKRIQRKEWKKLSVFDAGLKGRGLMVMEHCQPNDFIIEYVGVAVKKQYLDGLFSRYKHERMLYIMALDNDVYIDARHRGGIARYINHSCEPNCVVHRWKVKGISRAGVFALRELHPGEELSFDYKWDRKRGRALTKCHCGARKCRGTIETEAKDGDLEDDKKYTQQLIEDGHWIDIKEGTIPGKSIMNRIIKVYSNDNNEDTWKVADVAQYDGQNGKHLLMYHGDDTVAEHWVELCTKKWMVLHEPLVHGALEGLGDGQGSYAIARKNEYGRDPSELPKRSLLINAPDQQQLGGTDSDYSPRGGTPRDGTSPMPPMSAKVRSYMYIQTPVKDIMVARHTLFKCSQYSRVHIDTVKLTVPRDWVGGGDVMAEDEEEAALLQKAYDESKDGVVWKLNVTGMEVKKAVEWLEKILGRINNDLYGTELPDPSSGLASSGALNGSSTSLVSAGGAGAAQAPEDNSHSTEVIIPRIIVDEVKKRFFSLKGYCYNCDVDFKHSDSKSKQFAKISLSAELGSDLDNAMEYLNKELTTMCQQHNAPMTDIGVYKDFGWLGGELENNDYRMLFADLKKTLSSTTVDASEDLRGSTFATSFMKTNRCSIWVQAEEDMGRVSNNRVINEAHPYKPRKIYFGVTPSRVSTLWGYMKSRIVDLTRGVQFLHLGPDKIYQSALLEPIRKNGRSGGGWNYFFEFVQDTSGASVGMDPVTGSTHLRIDGGDSSVGGEEGNRQVNERIDVAIELISLQIELLRDHHIRKQRWGFGRDWALLLDSDQNMAAANLTTPKGSEANSIDNASSKLTSTAVGTACLEISEIVTGSGLSEKVAAHACIIFYRYINLPNSKNSNNDAASSNTNASSGSFKLRDVQLAALYIANKSQKNVKWRRLEAVLEHAYRVFYPGSLFNSSSEEAKNWERRVIKAEKDVLTALNYDVFWSGVDWVINAVVGTKAMAEPLAENAMSLALSGHVLAAGPLLWLKYGPKYAFAAICGFLSIDIEPLFPALSLQPLTVSHAAELIYHSCQALSRVKKSSALKSKHELFSDSKTSVMGTNIQKIQKDCAMYMSKHQGSKAIDDAKFISSPAHKEVGERAKLRRVFRAVRSDVIEEKILPVLAKICFESKCTIRFSDGMLDGTNDIVLEGSWKTLSIAEHLLCEVGSLPAPIPYENLAATNAMLYSALAGVGAQQQDTKTPNDSEAIKQVKNQPGLLEMKQIDGKHGWYGTFDSAERYDAGWKTCIAANAPRDHLDSAGLRWWVPHQYGPSLGGSLCEIFSSPKLINHGSVDMKALALMAQSFAGGYTRMQTQYPTLASFMTGPEGDEAQENDQTVALSLQRWPPEKVQNKERSTLGSSMRMGYSAAALQEMQLLHQLHFLIPSPQGHPNFILPLAIALDDTVGEDDPGTASSISSAKASNDILAMLERNQRSSGKKELVPGSHLVLEPTPINLQKVISRYQRKNNGGTILPHTVLASWCHDILSAISFCHSNHIILRSLLPDQIHLDHSGTAKLSGLSKVMVLHGKDRTKEFKPLKDVRKKKGRDHNTEDVEPFAAPELLLGGTRHTKETDMWAFGALLANLLIGKQLFPGKDRVSKMTQVFKIVGVPDRNNYEDAKKFPFYSNNMFVIGDEGKKKKYSRGVEKALRHLLRAFGDDAEADFAGLIGLIDGLLHLDPKKRMTADKALRHPFMMNHSAHIERQEFRQNYVKDWLDLKENVLTKGKSSRSSLLDTFVPERKQIEETPFQNPTEPVQPPISMEIGGSAEKEQKRKAFLIDASAGADGDDLYNLDDLIGGPSSHKKPKFDM